MLIAERYNLFFKIKNMVFLQCKNCQETLSKEKRENEEKVYIKCPRCGETNKFIIKQTAKRLTN